MVELLMYITHQNSIRSCFLACPHCPLSRLSSSRRCRKSVDGCARIVNISRSGEKRAVDNLLTWTFTITLACRSALKPLALRPRRTRALEIRRAVCEHIPVEWHGERLALRYFPPLMVCSHNEQQVNDRTDITANIACYTGEGSPAALSFPILSSPLIVSSLSRSACRMSPCCAVASRSFFTSWRNEDICITSYDTIPFTPHHTTQYNHTRHGGGSRNKKGRQRHEFNTALGGMVEVSWHMMAKPIGTGSLQARGCHKTAPLFSLGASSLLLHTAQIVECFDQILAMGAWVHRGLSSSRKRFIVVPRHDA